MNFSRLIEYIQKYQAVLTLVAWVGALLLVLSNNPYGFTEMGAKALAVVWSVVEGMTSMKSDYLAPAVLDSVPDFRVLWFFPPAIYWPENLIAVKLFIAALFSITAYLLYIWARKNMDQETALIGTGLLLLSPVVLTGIDTLGAGPFLLFGMVLADRLDETYRAQPNAFGIVYFIQLLVAVSCVSLHPAGLAVVAALMWQWHKQPLPERRHSAFFIYGLTLVTLLVLVVRMGWPEMQWFQNPIESAASTVLGTSQPERKTTWLLGALLLLGWILAVLFDRAFLLRNRLGRMIMLGSVIGTVAAEQSWALLVTVMLLYRGITALARWNSRLPGNGFLSQRGIVAGLMFVLCVQFMLDAKTQRARNAQSVLEPVDQLIFNLNEQLQQANRAAGPDNPPSFRIASQWPARTLLACKCFVAALPPPAADAEKLLENMGSITHIVLDPRDPANTALAGQLADLSGTLQTVDHTSSGVILFNRKNATIK